MRILVMADNHGDWDIVEEILRREPHDFAMHLGDADVDESIVAAAFDAYVGGNHDYDYKITEQVVNIDGLGFFLTHGHRFSYFYGAKIPGSMMRAAQDAKASIILRGHLHIPLATQSEGMMMFCPGSVSQPRSMEGPTYLTLEVENGKLKSYTFHHAETGEKL